jgi:tyrosine-protein phosphatase SIW14
MSIKILTIIFASGIMVPLATMTALATFADNDANATAAQPTQIAKETQQDVTAPKPALKMKEDLPNFHEVHPYLFRGGEPNEAGLQKLKDMGIATIIDLRAPSEMKINERDDAQKLGMHYINLIMDSRAPTEKQVDEMMKEIDKAKTLSEQGEKNKNIFVHCAHGSDRTGCMIGIWRVTREGYDYPTAYKEMRKYYFTPKFTRLSGAVEQYAAKAHPAAGESARGSTSKEQ